MRPCVFRKLFLAAGLLVLAGVSPVRADPLNSVAKKLAKEARKLPAQRVAVLLFPYENGDLSSGSSLVSEHLTSLLAQRRGVKVIERSLLASVLGEIRLEGSGVTDSSGTPALGGILGVDAVVTGTLSDLDDDVTVVNARLIQIPSGEILAAASAEIDRVWPDAPKPPPTYAETTGEDKPYVLHESELIYTPTVRRGVYRPMDTYAEVPAAPAGAMDVSLPIPPPTAVPALVITSQVPTPARRPVARSRAALANGQLLYAMGLTLDMQGHPRRAQRFYQRVLREAPDTSPLRSQARRLAGAPSPNTR